MFWNSKVFVQCERTSLALRRVLDDNFLRAIGRRQDLAAELCDVHRATIYRSVHSVRYRLLALQGLKIPRTNGVQEHELRMCHLLLAPNFQQGRPTL